MLWGGSPPEVQCLLIPSCGHTHLGGLDFDPPARQHHWVSPPPSCSSSPLPTLSPWTCQGLSLAWTSESPRVGRIRKGLSGECRLASARSRAVPLVMGVGKLGRRTVSGQTWEPAHGPCSKAGAVPGAPAGSLASFIGRRRA